MALFRTHRVGTANARICQDLARALRAGDDASAARFAAELRNLSIR